MGNDNDTVGVCRPYTDEEKRMIAEFLKKNKKCKSRKK
jgi:hypothetical protein